MNNLFIIHFTRSDKNYPLSGCCSYRSESNKEKNKVNKLYNWLLKKHNKINVLLKHYNQTFFNDIKLFCISNELNFKEPLFLYTYIKDNKFYIEISQGTYEDCINLDNSIYAKIAYENNIDKVLTFTELNNFSNNIL